MIGKPGHYPTREHRVAKGIPASSIALGLILASLVLSFQASAAYSTSSSGGINVSLITTGGDNWTRAGATSESITINVTNSYDNLTIKEVNMTLSTYIGNAVFGVSSTPSTNDSWICYIYAYDGASNAKEITCNTSTAYITQYGSISVTLTAMAMSLSSEAAWNFNVTTLNATNAISVSQNITSGIDGLAPRFYAYNDNVTIASGDQTARVWLNVSDMNLNTAVSIRVVNVSTNATVSSPAVNDVYMEAYVWNISANIPLTGFADGNYTINVSAQDNVSNYNQTISTSWFFVDAMAPVVTQATPAEGGWNTSSYVNFTFLPYDTSGSLSSCRLWLNSSAFGLTWHANATLTSPVNNQNSNITLNHSLAVGSYTWAVECNDTKGNSAFSENRTLNIGSRSNIIVSAITVPMNPSPYPGQSILVNVTVSNNGTGNAQSGTVLRFCNATTSNPCTSYTNDSITIPATNLTAGAAKNVTYNITVSSTYGSYYLSAYADYNNNENESDEGDNSLFASFSTLLTVTLMNITYTNPPNASGNISLYVNVTFYNGTGVSNIPLINFSVYDDWLSSAARARNESAALNYTRLVSVSGQNVSGVYLFNYTVPAMTNYSFWDDGDNEGYEMRYAEYGSHRLVVYVNESVTGRSHYGQSSSSTPYTYNMTAPYLSIDLSAFSSIEIGETKDRDVAYQNLGTENITATLTAHEPDEDSDDNGDVDIDDNLTSDVSIYGLNISDPHVIENVAFFGDVAGTVRFTFNISVTHNGEKYWYAKIFDVTVEPAEEEEEDGGTTTTSQNYECTLNATCATDKWCKNLACVALTCPTGYTATDHVCKFRNVYEVSITSFESAVAMLQGGTATKTVSVQNTGNTNLTVTVTAEPGVDGVNTTVNPSSYLIGAGNSKNFTVTFSSGSDVPIGKYTGSFKATTSFTSAKDSEAFTLTINPLPGAIEELEVSYENYTMIYDQLVADFTAVKGQLTGDNLTILETKVNETMTLFASLKQSMEDEDYAQAAVYMSQLDALIDSTRSTMTSLGIEEGVGSIWSTLAIWIIVGVVCVGAAGLLLYMVVPEQGYSHGKGYNPHDGKDAVKHKFGEFLSSLKNIVPKRGPSRPATASEIVKQYRMSYDGHYKKLESTYKLQSPGNSDKFKSLFKKK